MNRVMCALGCGSLAVVVLAAGPRSAQADGPIVAWGSNYDHLGNYLGQCNVPSPNTGFVAAAAGYWHSLGLKADGSIVAWGDNYYGQCNVPSPNTGLVAVAAGYIHSLGLKADGSIVAWGAGQVNTGTWPDYGQCIVPSPNTGFVAVAGGGSHSLGLKADGSIVAWGWNNDGQCNVPSPNTGFVAVAAGGYHSLGMEADGSIMAWGWNGYGQCNVPSPNAGFVAVAGGGWHALGLKGLAVVTSFVINNGASSSTSRTVILNNTCSDTPTEYIASELPNFAGATWHSYSPAPSFVLSAGSGTKTVYFKVRNAVSESALASDTITLNDAISIVAWRSLRQHGSLGELAIQLNPAATGVQVISETRLSGIQKIEVDFTQSIAGLLVGTVIAENANSPGATFPATTLTLINDGTTLVLKFGSGLPNGACYRIDLAGHVLGLVGDTDCLVRGLAGDVNGDGDTDLIDMAWTKSKNMQAVDPDNIRFDVNLDGSIDLIDMAWLRSWSLASVSCPAN